MLSNICSYVIRPTVDMLTIFTEVQRQTLIQCLSVIMNLFTLKVERCSSVRVPLWTLSSVTAALREGVAPLFHVRHDRQRSAPNSHWNRLTCASHLFHWEAVWVATEGGLIRVAWPSQQENENRSIDIIRAPKWWICHCINYGQMLRKPPWNTHSRDDAGSFCCSMRVLLEWGFAGS